MTDPDLFQALEYVTAALVGLNELLRVQSCFCQPLGGSIGYVCLPLCFPLAEL